MKKDRLKKDFAPASKADIADVKTDIDVLKADFHALRAEMATKTDIAGLRADVESYRDEVKRHFAVMVETMKHEFRDAFHDGYSSLRDKQNGFEERMDRVERTLNLAPMK